ncbi:hypothetical protein MMC22_002540 [Lobaria immixta]|nr:hypothetical protein [Lobaria immixta]
MTDTRPVFFFDIDNCLYSRSKKVQELMQDLIDDYFVTHLSLSRQDANELHLRYYKDYGLAIAGLVLHHKIDPLEFNRQVDDALPLDTIIVPDTQLQKLLADIDRTKVKPWLFTNAYINHARRVIRLLGVEDMFEGITYCDYGNWPFVCKPHEEMFRRAEEEAGASSVKDCYFVVIYISPFPPRPSLKAKKQLFQIDDSALNCRHAHSRGWTTTHILEPDDPEPTTKAAKHQIRSLEELRELFPQFFNSTSGADRDAAPSKNLQ